ncbi:MAG: DUF4097 family beta strand repeat protein [Clostridia bacterium]|nr:DUF4097 family beta strand repeat protein [Clostridia bacterium]
MTKREFLEMLNERTSCLSEAERDRLLEYYGEIIDDHMEEGLTEAEAVAALGDPAALTRDYADPAAEGATPNPEIRPAGESVAALNGLRIRVDSADVTIARGALDNGAAAQLRFSDPARFEWRMDGDVMEIVEKSPEGPRFSLQRVLHLLSSPAQHVKVTLAAPLDGAFSYAAGGGDLTLEGAAFGGGAGIDSASGDVTLRTFDCGGDLKLSTRSGDVRLEGVRVAGSLRVHLASGDLASTHLSVAGESRIDAASGDIDLRKPDLEALAISTASGDIELFQGSAAATEIHAASGDVDLKAMECNPTLAIETATGDVSLGRCIALETRVKTASGDVDVRLARLECGYDIVANSASGDVRLPDDNPPAREGLRQPRLAIRTASGDIDVKIVRE